MTDTYSKLVTPGPDEELYQHEPRPLAVGINPQDGLPQHVQETSLEDSYAPPLLPENLVCMADDSEYVTLQGERVPKALVVKRNGRAQVSTQALANYSNTGLTEYVNVQPIRPQCVHYVRRLVNIQGNHENRILLRCCTAFKTEEGEYESLGNTCVFACEQRSPPDPRSAELIERFDEEKVRLGRERIAEQEEFDVTAALQREADALADDGVLKG